MTTLTDHMLRNLYQGVWRHSPRPIASLLSRAIFRSLDRPSWVARPPDRTFWVGGVPITLAPFPEGRRGAMVFSADFEMAWAWRYSKSPPAPAEEMGLKERRNVPRLLELFDQYWIPVTWATVGHLFLERCEKKNGVPHPELRRIPHFENRHWRFDRGDWYDHDPCSDMRTAPAWYAPDLLRMIQASSVQHEIGCHTFSHIDFSDVHCPDEVAADEIRACKTAMASLGLVPRSMVFPAGTAGHFALLAREGFTCIRKRVRDDVELSYPMRTSEGLWMLPSSAGIGDEGLGWSSAYMVRRLCKYVDRAIDKGLVCHFWFHPSLGEQSLEDVLPEVLRYAGQRRDEGALWVTTMAEMANYCECVYQARLEPANDDGTAAHLYCDVDTSRFDRGSVWITCDSDSRLKIESPLGLTSVDTPVTGSCALAWKVPDCHSGAVIRVVNRRDQA